MIGVITVKNGRAVQSFGYDSYLPLGKPWCLAENLDRWGVDEILILSVDRSINNSGPDYSLLKSILKAKLSVPVIYGGGIVSKDQAIKVIQNGADRIVLDSVIHDNPSAVYEIAASIGSQAIIASLPVTLISSKLYWYNYRTKKNNLFSNNLNKLISDMVISELLIVDIVGNGRLNGFNVNILKYLDFPANLVLFGGINSDEQISKLLSDSRVSAISLGNSLNYNEHAVQKIKRKYENYLRLAIFNEC